MKKLVSFTLDVPDAVTSQDLIEWLRFVLGNSSMMQLSKDCPLLEMELEAEDIRLTGEPK